LSKPVRETIAHTPDAAARAMRQGSWRALVHYLALHRLASCLGQATLDCRLHSCIGKEPHQGAQTFRNIEEIGREFCCRTRDNAVYSLSIRREDLNRF
jgi:hypothetical protein